MHLYLSFARIDEPYALKFANILTRDHTLAYDDRLFAPDWWQRTLIQLDSCDALLYFISPEGAAAEYCRRECEVMQQAGRAVIPILIVDGAPVLTMLEGYTMLDFRAGITAEGEAALRAVLAAVEVDKTQTVYGVEAAKRPLEVTKDEPGALITEANQEAFEEKWERVVYLLRSALATGFTSQLVDVDQLLREAEAELMEAEHERQAARAYSALRHSVYRFSNVEAYRADARTFAQSYPGYDPDGVLHQAGVQVASPTRVTTRPQADAFEGMSSSQRWSGSGFDLQVLFNLLRPLLFPRTEVEKIVFVGFVIAVFVIALVNPFRSTAPSNQGRYPYATSVRNVSTPTPIVPRNVAMSLVEGGCFEMDDDRVCLDSYWLDRYEVSNQQFASYRGRAASNPPSRLELHPRTQITYLEARRFCESRDARLPTESEWEFAIGGGRNMDYPWGDEFIEGHANVAGDGDGYYLTSPVFAYAEYQSPERVVNLIGNVAEWVDAEDDLFTSQVVRGGSYRTTVNAEGQFNDRYTRSERFRSDDVGFRCARDAETAQNATPIPSPSVALPLVQINSPTMQFVSGGCFRMGSNGYSPSETPAHEVCVDDFWMDRYEVIYGEFERGGGIARESNAVYGRNFPRTNVTWSEARAYCIERGARLPTEAEWEYAASNQGRSIYPWGDVFRSFNANVANQPQWYEGVAPVNAYADYATAAGIVNLSGNVAEWVNSVFAPYPYDSTDGRESFEGERRVIRGGSYRMSAVGSRAASRNSHVPSYSGDDLGFRCARDA
jgi:formylglycine-generating enzyme required for sulfatase activity